MSDPYCNSCGSYDRTCRHGDRDPLIDEIARLKALIHDADTTPLSEWAATLAAAKENVEATTKLLAESQTDNERLKALLKEIERRGSGGRCPFWACDTWPDQLHDSDCPAFTPAGEVK